MKHKKHPSRIEEPPIGKAPRGGEKLDQIKNLPVGWHIRSLDREGRWCWTCIEGSVLWATIHSKLANFENMKWSEILRDKSHDVAKSLIIPEAQARLKKIRQDDVDSLVSLRLDGKKRIWGIRKHNILRILWWDPHHEICPSLKD